MTARKEGNADALVQTWPDKRSRADGSMHTHSEMHTHTYINIHAHTHWEQRWERICVGVTACSCDNTFISALTQIGPHGWHCVCMCVCACWCVLLRLWGLAAWGNVLFLQSEVRNKIFSRSRWDALTFVHTGLHFERCVCVCVWRVRVHHLKTHCTPISQPCTLCWCWTIPLSWLFQKFWPPPDFGSLLI